MTIVKAYKKDQLALIDADLRDKTLINASLYNDTESQTYRIEQILETLDSLQSVVEGNPEALEHIKRLEIYIERMSRPVLEHHGCRYTVNYEGIFIIRWLENPAMRAQKIPPPLIVFSSEEAGNIMGWKIETVYNRTAKNIWITVKRSIKDPRLPEQYAYSSHVEIRHFKASKENHKELIALGFEKDMPRVSEIWASRYKRKAPKAYRRSEKMKKAGGRI